MHIARIALGAALAAALTVPAVAHGATIERDNHSYTMTKTAIDADRAAAIDAVERNWGRRVDVAEVINNATQETRPLAGGGPRPNDTVGGFRWAEGNEEETDWYPQGITGSADAWADGIVGGHRELIVSWHSENPDDAYARITLVNADDLDDGKYRHVLLVFPTASGDVRFIQSHAGGIAWYRTRLYVADTNRLLVFDMGDLIKVRPERRDEVRTYDYILPARGNYDAPNNPGLRFSSVSVDRSNPGQHALVTSEWLSGNEPGGRIVRWPLNESTGLMGPDVTASGAWTANGVRNIQGALMKDGKFGISTSYGRGNPGTWYSGRVGQTLDTKGWPEGAEDVHYAPTSNRIYSLTEFKSDRLVFAVNANTRGW